MDSLKSFLNSPVGHGVATIVSVAFGLWVSAGSPGGTITVAAVVKVLYSYLVAPTGTTIVAGSV